MKYEKNRKIAGIDELKLRKMMKFLIFPLITLVLVIVIVVADRSGRKSASAENPSGMTGESTDENGGADGNLSDYNLADYKLQKNAVPEIDALIKSYQKAQTDGNAEAMYQIFGRKDKTGLEALRTKLSETKKLYESYQNTVNYVLPGIEKDAWVVYTNCRIKFKDVDTPAPSLTRAYVLKNSSGKYYIKEPDKLSKEEQKRVDDADNTDEVKLMNAQMRTDLAKAVVSDAKLGSLYRTLEAGGTAAPEETSAAASGSETESVQDATIRIEDASALTAPATTAATTAAATTSAAATSAAATTESASQTETSAQTAAESSAASSEGAASAASQ